MWYNSMIISQNRNVKGLCLAEKYFVYWASWPVIQKTLIKIKGINFIPKQCTINRYMPVRQQLLCTVKDRMIQVGIKWLRRNIVEGVSHPHWQFRKGFSNEVNCSKVKRRKMRVNSAEEGALVGTDG